MLYILSGVSVFSRHHFINYTSFTHELLCANSPNFSQEGTSYMNLYHYYVCFSAIFCTVYSNEILITKISPVGDWRSTSLEWPWPWSWFRPYGIPSCITHRPLPTYQISLRSEENFFWKSPLRFWSSSESRDKKLGQISKIWHDQI